MLTVLLATHNGARTLPGVLESYERLQPPPGGWKLVVVDNASTDRTRQILAGFEGRLPLTSLFEPVPAKNAALNTGLSSIDGDLVVLTDDDTFPRPNWLVEVRAAADRHPAFAFFGGPVLPRWEIPPPAWLLKSVALAPTFTVSDASLTEGAIKGHHVFGPNMAVRRAVFEAGHRFDSSIGPNPSKSYAMGSETEFVERLEANGLRGWYAPAAVVEHFVRSAQMRRRWILERTMRFGRGQCRLGRPVRDNLPGGPGTLASSPLYHLVRKSGSLLIALFSFSEVRLFRAALAWSFVYGYVREALSRGKR